MQTLELAVGKVYRSVDSSHAAIRRRIVSIEGVNVVYDFYYTDNPDQTLRNNLPVEFFLEGTVETDD